MKTLELDITHLQAVESALEDWPEATPLSVLVHSAGAGGFASVGAPEDMGLWHELIQVNLNGAYHVAQAVLKRMQTHGTAGSLIFISSDLGLKGMARAHAYSAAKHGVNGMVKSLAMEVVHAGITINSICPGWVKTPMAEADFHALADHHDLSTESFTAAEIEAVPIQRWIEPEEVAELALYLTTARAMTGRCLTLSGGA